MIIAGFVFFSSIIATIFLSQSLFKHLKQSVPEYYASKGSPDFPFGFEPVSLSRQFKADKYLLSVIFGKAKDEVASDTKAYRIIKAIRKAWFFAVLPSWVVWGAGIVYLAVRFPNGIS